MISLTRRQEMNQAGRLPASGAGPLGSAAPVPIPFLALVVGLSGWTALILTLPTFGFNASAPRVKLFFVTAGVVVGMMAAALAYLRKSLPMMTVSVQTLRSTWPPIGPGTKWCFSVSDRGPGISEADLPRLFQQFSRLRLPDDRQIPGSEFGLFISRRIVEGHGGRMWAESTVGVGSRFCFSLPVRDDD